MEERPQAAGLTSSDIPTMPVSTELRRRLRLSLDAGMLPVLRPSDVAVSGTVRTATASVTDVSDPRVLNQVVWPDDLADGHPGLRSGFTEQRRLEQLVAFNASGRRLDLTLAVDCTPRVVRTEGGWSPRFTEASAGERAERYLRFIRCFLKALHLVAPTLHPHLEALREEVDAALSQSIASDDDLRRKVFDLLTVSDVAQHLRWEALRPKTSGLALLYNFVPFADTASTVASKRLRQFARTMDVISCSSLNRKKIDPTISVVSRPYVASQAFLDLTPSWSSWEPFERFCREGLREIAALERSGREYAVVYSRAMWAPSHYLAAAYRQRSPAVRWIAEFSDPLSLDVEGNSRGQELPRHDFLQTLIRPVEAVYGQIPPDQFTIFRLAEILPFALADSIVFTNEHQMATMLETVYSDRLAERVVAHAEVSNHPTLPSAYYKARPVEYEVDPTKVNLAYFGEFYATRGITDVTVAMRMLPVEVRENINVHVFTNFVPESGLNVKPPGMPQQAFDNLVKRAQDGVGASGIEHLVTFNASLPYLEFLGVSTAFDYLIVNDAHSGAHHRLNPYLPSKWSDYAGSTAPTWALVEDGSVLSTKNAALTTPVGDPNAARAVLWDLVERKREGRHAA